MKKLLALLLLLASSTGHSSIFSSGLFGNLGQCGAPSMDSVLLPLMMMQQMAPMADPVEELENEIEDLKDRGKDLKSDIRSARRASAVAEQRAQQIEERMSQLGCTGDIASSPLPCLSLRSRQRRMQAKADIALADIEAMKDEISDIREDIKDLRAQRSDAEKQKQQQQVKKAMQMKMLADLMSTSASQQQQQIQAPSLAPTVAAQPSGPAGFSGGFSGGAINGMQASCPHCNVPAFSGTSPGSGIANLSSHLSPVLENQIRERNRQLGWPNTPSAPNSPTFPSPRIAQPSYPFIMQAAMQQPPFATPPTLAFGNPMDPFGMNCFPSATGPQFGGAFGGDPAAGGMFPGGAISSISTPFNGLPPVPVQGGAPIHGGAPQALPAIPVSGIQPAPGGLAPIQVQGVR